MPRVVIIGAGAAGSMAAIFAAKAGAETILLERTRDGGRKILISGGGRCNVLPMHLDESRFVTDSSPNVLRKMIRSWPLAEQRAFFEQDLGIALVDEPDAAKVFPASHKARDVRDALLSRAYSNGAELRFNTLVTGLSNESDKWRVATDNGATLEADAVIVATGGLSVPNTGSDGFGLKMLAELQHTMHPTYAALTPMLAQGSPFAELAGISLPVSLDARSEKHSATASGGFLFTHHGYSGPSVLDVSHVVVRSRREGNASAKVRVGWTALNAAAWEEALKPKGVRTVTGALRAEMPDRLAAMLLEQAGVDATRTLSELRRDERLRLIDTLTRGELPWDGDEGYKKAEVTGGGVALSEVDPRSMESKRHKGLFICGEVLDAFGPIGGYNFLWSWATGRAAGIGAAASLSGKA
ncbi:MAG: aminoacetone oxidase family FAD-binding enzyme [Phycisphaerae bacterium]|nr:aminoacetone oxidase family FAD-binding enzyme [Gemmatimonadaceae bacterium]